QRGVDQELVVERARREQLEAWQCSDAFGSVGGFRVRLAGDVTQTGWPHQREVRRDADGQQRLAGADVGGRLLAADVLLACLQGEHVAATAVVVARLARDAT